MNRRKYSSYAYNYSQMNIRDGRIREEEKRYVVSNANVRDNLKNNRRVDNVVEERRGDSGRSSRR